MTQLIFNSFSNHLKQKQNEILKRIPERVAKEVKTYTTTMTNLNQIKHDKLMSTPIYESDIEPITR